MDQEGGARCGVLGGYGVRFTREVLRVESWRLGAIPDQNHQPLNARG